MTRRLLVFGTSELGEIVAAHLEHEAPGAVAAFVVDPAYHREDELHGIPVVSSDDVAERFDPATHDMLVTIGYHAMNDSRRATCERMRASGYALGSYISPGASIGPGVELGENSIVLGGAHVQPFAKVGVGVVLWPGVVVSHHATLGDWCFLAPSATVAGNTTIRANCFLGANCTIRDGVSLGERTLVGAGALVTRDTAAGSVIPGTPSSPDPARTSADVRGF